MNLSPNIILIDLFFCYCRQKTIISQCNPSKSTKNRFNDKAIMSAVSYHDNANKAACNQTFPDNQYYRVTDYSLQFNDNAKTSLRRCTFAVTSPVRCQINEIWYKGGLIRTAQMSRLMTKPTKRMCAQQRLRSAWASAQSYQSLPVLMKKAWVLSCLMTKPTKCMCRQVWSESSLCAQWVAKNPSFLHADREDWSDWVDAQADPSLWWAHMPFCWFCHETTRMKNPQILTSQ